MSEYVHHYSKIQLNNVAKVRDWLQAGSLPKSSLPSQTSNEVDTQAERMKTLSLNEVRGGELNSKAEDAISKVEEDYYRADETLPLPPLPSRCKKLKNNVSTNVSFKTTKSEEHCICLDCSLNKLCSMFPKLNPHQLYQVLIKNQFDLQKAIKSLLDIPPSSTKSRSRNAAKTGSSPPEYGTVSHSENAVSGTSRTEPLLHFRTEITANSRTRSSQTVSETNSILVSSNVTRTTPHSFETCSMFLSWLAEDPDLSDSEYPLSPSRSTPAMPPYPECAVCFTSLAGSRIYPCAQGHSLCRDCDVREWRRGLRYLVNSNVSETDSCLTVYGAVTHTGNAVSATTRTEPHHLGTEITANSRTKRSSPTVSETKSSVSNNVTSSTPHMLDTRSILTGQISRQKSISPPVSPMSPSQSAAAPPAIPTCPECPVCFSSLAGSRIYQCAQGHSICGDRNKNPQVKNCPTCRGKLVGRATNMEQLLASIYSGQ